MPQVIYIHVSSSGVQYERYATAQIAQQKIKNKNEDLALCKQHRERDVPAAGYYQTLSV